MEPAWMAPTTATHKTYVFVDEYNRHKRLKVMRACDGCRKRKIRCDGALQNGPWPCGACMRLKLKCTPPTLDLDDDSTLSDEATESSPMAFRTSAPTANNTPNGLAQQPSPSASEWSASARPAANVGPTSAPVAKPNVNTSTYSTPPFGQRLASPFDLRYADATSSVSSLPVTAPLHSQSHVTEMPRLARSETEVTTSSSGDPHEVDTAVRQMSEQMGDLSIEFTSVAPYIVNEMKALAEAPTVDDVDVVLPASVGTDTTVRIPPEMMPSEERALDYFGFFFTYIHPYVPVLSRRMFYDQWSNARQTISPLLLEAIFACVSRYLEEPIVVRRWLALAARHEESFKDVPRLSTIQALIIFTKAKEFVPKRGYYYRSWMAVKYMVTMALDLGLHEHYRRHSVDQTCELSWLDCTIRNRIWQTLFLLELVVGAPQGRTDFTVDVETVDLELPELLAGMDEYEHQTSRRTTYLTQAARNTKRTNSMWQAGRYTRKDWALEPSFVHHNMVIKDWLQGLPSDMQINYPDDDSPPWLGGNHHLAYLHIYHHLIVIMHHRPQLQALLGKGDPAFKAELDICNDSAAFMCRLQEALYRDFKMHGLQFMQRGLGFTIYSILTCTMLHLATITSPDPNTNSRAREYFTRHMRILEYCIPSASPEIQVQIITLRQAFSQDTSKPFELKPSLGLRSPTETKPSPSFDHNQYHIPPIHVAPTWSHLQEDASSHTISPASEYGHPLDRQAHANSTVPFQQPSFNTLTHTPYGSVSTHQVSSGPNTAYSFEHPIGHENTTPTWDPSIMFNQWNTAFGQPQAAPPLLHDQPVQPPTVQMIPQQYTAAPQPIVSPLHHLAASSMPSLQQVGSEMPTVTPVMWQEAFTNAYVSGQGYKRYREESLEPNPFHQYHKRRG